MHYSPKVDPIIYTHARDFSPGEFAELALAAADQAGLNIREQAAMRKIFEPHGLLPEQPLPGDTT